ncbi:conserved hypothetical protein [Methylocella silvestris BL2]|uniref:Uncharacterized protein n=1 Tax=Methylocella silvestris (strain DSM 15510 / CIP 108128 / LMG 27833 / NCIMB 13906 / BL2) TaxID=395965 RepID=B8EQY6_METSB|nr:hypothetical protein [Methylocella silvestris]ACK49731.1 conserved hypothetical protein [Methylocella silvestris BL2]
MPTTFAQIIRRILLRLAEALVIFYVALDSIFTPIFRPLVRWAAGLRVVRRLQDLVAELPPYAILAALAIPFGLAEPAKIYALVLFAGGRWLTGVILMALAYLVSLVLVERIYDAGRDKLRTISWFARLMDWLVAFRDSLLAWARSTKAYALAMQTRRRAVEIFGRVRAQLRLR